MAVNDRLLLDALRGPRRTATLLVDALSSRCSACGGNADPGQRIHVNGGRQNMWAPGSALSDQNGCLAQFIAVDNPSGRPPTTEAGDR